jgi:hypothetical protein
LKNRINFAWQKNRQFLKATDEMALIGETAFGRFNQRLFGVFDQEECLFKRSFPLQIRRANCI